MRTTQLKGYTYTFYIKIILVIYTQSTNHICIPHDNYCTINHYTYTQCCTNTGIHVSSAAANSSELSSFEVFNIELDSHTNMPVVGCGTYIVAHTGNMADVQAYNPDCESKQIPIVDTTLQYDNPYDGRQVSL